MFVFYFFKYIQLIYSFVLDNKYDSDESSQCSK